MSPRTGRPKKDDGKKCDIHIRVSKEEFEEIEFVANKLGISKSDAIIKGIEQLRANITNS